MFLYFILLVLVTCKAEFRNITCHSVAGFECLVTYSTASTDCSNLHSKFPHLYWRENDLYPNKPSYFHLTPLQEEYLNTNKFYPGVNVSIKVPLDASFQAVRGFELMRKFSDTANVTACYIFSFSGSNLNSSTKNEEIQFKIWPNGGIKADYDFEVFSLPKPPESELKGMSVSQSVSVQAKLLDLNIEPSADWKTTISYYSDNITKLIYIEFAKPPQQYKFQKFRVKLIKLDENGAPEDVIENQVIQQYHYYFNHVQPGIYKVTVEPESSYADCHCYNTYSTCVTCLATATRQMIINNETVTFTTSVQPNTLIGTSSLEGLGGDDDDTSHKILASVLGSVIGVLLVVLLGYFLLLGRRKGYCLFKFDDSVPADHSTDSTITMPDNSSQTNVLENNSSTRTPIVYIVNAEDHSYHVKAVEAFTSFLQKNCQCNVIYAPWNLPEFLNNKYAWVSNAVEKADYVIIINSELSFKLFQSWKNKENQQWRPADHSPTFDLFLSSINHITKHIIYVNNPFKCISVHFDYTSNKYSLDELCSGAEYLIPEHLHDLMCHIHRISDPTAAGYDNIVYLDEQICSTRDGQNLLQSIRLATNFEQAHPHWFEENFDIGEQFDSGISETFPIEVEKQKHNTGTDHKQLYQIPVPAMQFPNNLNGILPRQGSTDDNNISAYLPLRISDRSNNSDMMNPPDYFEEPSIIGDEDVRSQQLRQEIYELNNRMVSQQNDHDFMYRQNIEDEVQSLGGMSV